MPKLRRSPRHRLTPDRGVCKFPRPRTEIWSKASDCLSTMSVSTRAALVYLKLFLTAEADSRECAGRPPHSSDADDRLRWDPEPSHIGRIRCQYGGLIDESEHRDVRVDDVRMAAVSADSAENLGCGEIDRIHRHARPFDQSRDHRYATAASPDLCDDPGADMESTASA